MELVYKFNATASFKNVVLLHTLNS